MGWCGEAGCWENLWVGADRQGKAGAGISKKVGRCGEERRGEFFMGWCEFGEERWGEVWRKIKKRPRWSLFTDLIRIGGVLGGFTDLVRTGGEARGDRC